MSWQNFAKEYLTFTKKDRIGILALLLLVAVIYLLPKVFSKSTTAGFITTDSTILKAIDTAALASSFSKEEEDEIGDPYQPTKTSYAKAELFPFDPNTLSADGWQRLGLSEKVTKTIVNYRNKGGRFYKPEDLKKIWGLQPGFYERVKNYIAIAAASPSLDAPRLEKQERKVYTVEINHADTSAFIQLPGIGSKLAARIVSFRDKLGGFYTVAQIGETYGLADSTFQKIRPYLNVNANAIKKISINSATKDELKVHPYIKWKLANAIVEYRNQHGRFSSLEDLKKIAVIDDSSFEKIKPYLDL